MRDVLKIPLSESIVVILDSGGGSLSHLSVSVGVLSEKYNIAPFYLPPHHTCAVMPLDMHPNRAFESHWAHIRSRSTSISSLQALDSAHECFERAYTKRNAVRDLQPQVCRLDVLLIQTRFSLTSLNSSRRLFLWQIVTTKKPRMRMLYPSLEAMNVLWLHIHALLARERSPPVQNSARCAAQPTQIMMRSREACLKVQKVKPTSASQHRSLTCRMP